MFIPFNVLAVIKAASKQITRYAINGVFFERSADGARATATDGHRLLSVKWSEDSPKQDKFPWNGEQKKVENFAGIIPASALFRASGVSLKKGNNSLGGMLLEETNEGNFYNLHAADLDGVNATIRIMDSGQKFPPYKDVIPKYATHKELHAGLSPDKKMAVRIGVNARYLAEAAMALSQMCPTESNTIIITIPTDPNKPVVLEAESTDKKSSGIGVIMPVQANL